MVPNTSVQVIIIRECWFHLWGSSGSLGEGTLLASRLRQQPTYLSPLVNTLPRDLVRNRSYTYISDIMAPPKWPWATPTTAITNEAAGKIPGESFNAIQCCRCREAVVFSRYQYEKPLTRCVHSYCSHHYCNDCGYYTSAAKRNDFQGTKSLGFGSLL